MQEMGDKPTPYDIGWFDDEDELGALIGGKNPAELRAFYGSLLRVDLAGIRPGALVASLHRAQGSARMDALFALADALKNKDLAEWIDADATRRARAEGLARSVVPADPGAGHNQKSLAELGRFRDWKQYSFPLIIVPGYTPLNTKEAKPGLHPACKRRVEQAYADFRAQKAPFVLLSGANVYPRGTPYYEALEMRKVLLKMGFPDERIVLDARARHSTTNLRNAGRIMLAHGLSRALIATEGGGIGGSDLFDQDFYFSNPHISTFYVRCIHELGYQVGHLSDGGDDHAIFEPSMAVMRTNWRDPLDP